MDDLIRYIERHGIDAVEAPGGILMALTVYGSGDDAEWEVVEPTWAAVRAWLGY